MNPKIVSMVCQEHNPPCKKAWFSVEARGSGTIFVHPNGKVEEGYSEGINSSKKLVKLLKGIKNFTDMSLGDSDDEIEIGVMCQESEEEQVQVIVTFDDGTTETDPIKAFQKAFTGIYLT